MKKHFLITLLLGVFLGITLELGALLMANSGNIYLYRYDAKDRIIWNSGISGKYVMFNIEEQLNFNERGEIKIDNSEIKYKKKAGVFRVVLLGTSMTLGWGDKHGGYGFYLKKLLEKRYLNKIEVINCGVFSSNISLAIKLWHRKCSRYQGVDLVVLQTSVDFIPNKVNLFFGERAGDMITEIELLSFNYPQGIDSPSLKQRMTFSKNGAVNIKLASREYKQIARNSNPLLPGYFHSAFIRLISNTYFLHKNFIKVRKVRKKLIKQKFLTPDRTVAIQKINKFNQELVKQHTKLVVLNLPNVRGFLLSPQKNGNFFTTNYDKSDWPQAETFLFTKLKERLAIKGKFYFQEYQRFQMDLYLRKVDSIDLLNKFQHEKRRLIYNCRPMDWHPSQKGYQLIAHYLDFYIRDTFFNLSYR